MTPCPKETAENLHIPERTPVLLYERIYYGNDDPIIYAKSYITLDHLPNFEKYDLAESSMVKIIEDDYHKQIYKFGRKLRAMSASNDLSKKLYVVTGFPLLYLSFQSYFVDTNTPFEDAALCYRTDIIDFYPDIY